MTTEQSPRHTVGILEPSLRGLQAKRYDPLAFFVNRLTGAKLVTRDVAIYRALSDEWVEHPFNLQAAVPRRPGQ